LCNGSRLRLVSKAACFSIVRARKSDLCGMKGSSFLLVCMHICQHVHFIIHLKRGVVSTDAGQTKRVAPSIHLAPRQGCRSQLFAGVVAHLSRYFFVIHPPRGVVRTDAGQTKRVAPSIHLAPRQSCRSQICCKCCIPTHLAPTTLELLLSARCTSLSFLVRSRRPFEGSTCL